MKTIYLIVMLVACSTGFSQIKVTDTPKTEVIGQNKQMGVLIAELSKANETYNFIYKDLTYKELAEYKNFTFKAGDFDSMYNLLTANGATLGEEKTIELESGDKLLITYKKYGKNVYAYTTHVSSAGVAAILPYFTTKQWNGIFGKPEK